MSTSPATDKSFENVTFSLASKNVNLPDALVVAPITVSSILPPVIVTRGDSKSLNIEVPVAVKSLVVKVVLSIIDENKDDV